MTAQFNPNILQEIMLDIGLYNTVATDYFWTNAPYIAKRLGEDTNYEIFLNAYNIYSTDYARKKAADFQEIFREEALKRDPTYHTYYHQKVGSKEGILEVSVISIGNFKPAAPNTQN